MTVLCKLSAQSKLPLVSLRKTQQNQIIPENKEENELNDDLFAYVKMSFYKMVWFN